ATAGEGEAATLPARLVNGLDAQPSASVTSMKRRGLRTRKSENKRRIFADSIAGDHNRRAGAANLGEITRGGHLNVESGTLAANDCAIDIRLVQRALLRRPPSRRDKCRKLAGAGKLTATCAWPTNGRVFTIFSHSSNRSEEHTS